MVRYLTMSLWPSSRIQIRMRPLLSFYCAGYCFVCNLLSVQFVPQCRERSGRWDQFPPFFLQSTLLLSTCKLVRLCWHDCTEPKVYICWLCFWYRPALHTRHGVISLQEHLHIVTATHLERPNLYLIEIRYPDPLKPNYLFLRDFCHTIFSNQCLYSWHDIIHAIFQRVQ